MKNLSPVVAALLLNAPLLARGTKVPVRQLGADVQVDGNSVSWTSKDGFIESFSCPNTAFLSLSADKKYAACCTASNYLRGSPQTEFHCCAEDHDVAGSKDVGFTCCPNGQAFDGTVCKRTCTNGKIMVNDKCVCPPGEIVGPDGVCKKEPCTSGLMTGKCYMFTGETGRRLAFKNGQYSEAQPHKDVIPGKFQLCRDKTCVPNMAIDPSHEVTIRDMHGSPPDALDAGQWLNNNNNGAHLGRTPDYAKAGKFSFTKWPCGKYCLTGFAKGLGPACPSEEPSVTFYGSTTEACVEFDLVEVPCKVRDDINNCIWRSGRDQCCGKIDCPPKALHH